MTRDEVKRMARKTELFYKSVGSKITDPCNKELLDMIKEDALKAFKEYYGKFDKRISKKGFRSYKFTINGNHIYVETTYKSGCHCGQSYDMNKFLWS